MILHIDVESFSSVDIRSGGAYRYVDSPDFEVLLIAYSIDGGEVKVFDMVTEAREDPLFDKHNPEHLPTELSAALKCDGCLIYAHNAQFERLCIRKMWGLDIPVERFRCVMVHGLYCGLPASLGDVGEALKMPVDKQKSRTGKALINLFCKPQKPTKKNGGRTRVMPWDEPEKWELFKEYNKQDVVAEMAHQAILDHTPVPDEIWAEYAIDQRINDAGVQADLALVDNAIRVAAEEEEALLDEAKSICGLDNPKSVAQLTEWLEKEIGEDVDDLRKETVTELLAQGVDSEAATRMLEIRQLISKTSTKKYDAVRNTVCSDGRIHGLFQFYGANRTGRFAGRLVQVQNLPRNSMEELDAARRYTRAGDRASLGFLFENVPDTLSQLIRTIFIPAPGHKLIVSDFSAIEARVIAWLANEEWVLEVFRTHGKIYEATASQMFGVPLERIKKGNPEYDLRQRGKVSTLACGYQGSVGAMERMDTGHKIDPSLYQGLVDTWRQANPNIVALWDKIGSAALSCVQTGAAQRVNGLRFDYVYTPTGQTYMTITLPSKRKLYYPRPHITTNRWDRPSLAYWGTDQTSKKWTEIETYGGKLTENVVQAIARDCLVVAMQRLAERGYNIVMHIHDEVVIDATPDQTLDDVNAIMGEPIPWAEGLPLKAAGSELMYYQKD